MGFSVAGLGLLGVALGYWIFIDIMDLENGYDILAAIGLGGSSIALSLLESVVVYIQKQQMLVQI